MNVHNVRAGFARLRPSALLFAALMSLAAPLAAAALDTPAGPVILTIDGSIATTNQDKAANFDRAMIEAMPVTAVKTVTPWTEGEVVFEGVLMRDLLDSVAANGETLRAVAINDYAVEIPVSDFREHDVILAWKADGSRMRVRDKGPLWVIYPWSDKAELRNEVHHARSIWQVRKLTVR